MNALTKLSLLAVLLTACGGVGRTQPSSSHDDSGTQQVSGFATYASHSDQFFVMGTR